MDRNYKINLNRAAELGLCRDSLEHEFLELSKVF